MKVKTETKVYFVSLLSITAFFFWVILGSVLAFPAAFAPLVTQLGGTLVLVIYLGVSLFWGSILALVPWGIAKILLRKSGETKMP